MSTDVPGHLKAVDYKTKAITDLGDQPVGNLDGLESDGKGGYLATDWVEGPSCGSTPAARPRNC